MKKLLALCTFLIFTATPLTAFAVDVTITLTASQAQRFAAACGEVNKLVDNQVPPQPRPCTMAEAKQAIIAGMKRLIIDVEGAKLVKAAVDAIVVPEFDPK